MTAPPEYARLQSLAPTDPLPSSRAKRPALPQQDGNRRSFLGEYCPVFLQFFIIYTTLRFKTHKNRANLLFKTSIFLLCKTKILTILRVSHKIKSDNPTSQMQFIGTKRDHSSGRIFMRHDIGRCTVCAYRRRIWIMPMLLRCLPP